MSNIDAGTIICGQPASPSTGNVTIRGKVLSNLNTLTKANDPIDNVGILKKKNGKGSDMEYTISKQDGSFSFTNSETGIYSIFMDYPGIPMYMDGGANNLVVSYPWGYFDILGKVNSAYVRICSIQFHDSERDVSICEGDSIYLGGSYKTQPGSYWDTLNAAHGGDSIILTRLSVNPLPHVNLGNDTTIHRPDVLILDAGIGFQNYLWNNGSTTRTLDLNSSILDTITYVFYVNVTDSNSCSNSDTIRITIKGNVGILDKNRQNVNFYMYPDPVRASSTIVYFNNSKEQVLVSIFNTMGIKVGSFILTGTGDNLKYTFWPDHFNLTNGIYWLQFSTNDLLIIRKIIICK